MNPATKQYLIFSLIISFILSIILNFFFFSLTEGSIFTGFPLSLEGKEGFANFLIKSINTGIFTIVLIVPVFLGIQWFLKRKGGGYY